MPAIAAEWVEIEQSHDSIMYVDKQSIIKDGKYRKAWFKFVYSEPKPISTYDSRTYDSAKVLWYYDCATKKHAVAQDLSYLGGEVVESSARKITADLFLDVTPDTLGESGYNTTCSHKLPK
jgi:hypothetical protein